MTPIEFKVAAAFAMSIAMADASADKPLPATPAVHARAAACCGDPACDCGCAETGRCGCAAKTVTTYAPPPPIYVTMPLRSYQTEIPPTLAFQRGVHAYSSGAPMPQYGGHATPFRGGPSYSSGAACAGGR